MKLNHLNLTVEDVQVTQDFLEQYFDLRCVHQSGQIFAALIDEDGFSLNLLKGDDNIYPETFHIGFPQEEEQQVDAIYNKLITDGYEAAEPSLAHGSYTFYFLAPGNFTIEVYCNTDKRTKTMFHSYFDHSND